MERTLAAASMLPPTESDAATQERAHAPVAYRPDIDGLRAVAVLAVVIYHAFPKLLPGGFAGVDVFFVISGYLICGILLKGLAQNDFSLFEFYVRRVNRIFPALSTMFVVTWLYGWLMLLPEEQRQLGRNMAAGAGFVLNLLHFSQTDRYFGAVESDPLIHLWSLGIEEQFYLIWPLLLLATWKWRKAQLLIVATAIAASFISNVSLVQSEPLAAFYLPSSRLWELALGGMLAHYQLFGTSLRPPITTGPAPLRLKLPGADARGVLGIGLIVAALFSLHGRMAYPGWWAIMPCAGALLLISAGPRSWVNRRLLSAGPMVSIGLISYPLYLWHWPLLALNDIITRRQATMTMTLAALVAAFALAWLTYRYIEKPLRFSNRRRRVAGGLCATMIACATIGLVTSAHIIPARSDWYGVGRFTAGTTEDWLAGSGTTWTRFVTGFITLGNSPQRVLFVGDSNMQQYYPRIEHVLAKQPTGSRSAVFAMRAGCAPPVEMVDLDRAACDQLLHDAIEYSKDPRVHSVVIAANWYRHFVAFGELKYFGEAGRPLKPGAEAALGSLERFIAALTQQGKRVYVVLNIPIGHRYDPKQMIQRSVLAPAFRVVVPSPARVDIDRVVEPIVSQVRQVAERAGASIIDPMASLCDAATCPAVTAYGEPMYRDFAHLRPSYVREHVRYLDATVLSPAATNVTMASR